MAALASYPLRISGHEGYAKAEVTAGGVPLNQLDCSSLESRRLPGVYVCGELLDVAGRIGEGRACCRRSEGALACPHACRRQRIAGSPLELCRTCPFLL